ncbi:MAG: ankyrin repeat domain-containing protein [Acidimicrobiales bacterium]|jgi:ankyrin repeat protein|nr:ankyrin repeat domain-containing protein [Acidimicrobiales bacterium]
MTTPRLLARLVLALALVLVLAALVVAAKRQTFLVHAAARGDVAILEALVTLGADPDSSSSGSLPLYAAAWHGRAAAVERLVALGADPNGLDPSGSTPLIAAASQGHDAVVELLLRRGARADLRGACGTALEVAHANGRSSTVAVLSGGDP